MREKNQSPPASHGCGAFLSLLLCLLCVISARPAAAQVNVTQSFTGSTAPGWTLSGTSSLTSGGADPSGNGWLRLTSNGGNQAGAAVYNTADALGSGIQVTFDFASWGGSGADGICFFLLDGSVATPVVGAYGGSLGYAQETNIHDGLTGGYLGVALDEYGNFSNPTEGRIGGIGLTPEAVVIRGSGSGQNGYPYLAGTANLTATYGKLDTPSVGTRPSQTGTGYRHCVITITPAQKVYVQVTYGYGTTPVTVVNGYDLTTATGQVARPATLKFGFAASTGGSNNYHEIRNFSIVPDVVADMAITKTHSGSFVRSGTGTYTLTASNVGSSATTAPVTVTDTLPTGLTPTAASGTGWVCRITGQTVTCTRSDALAAGTAYPAITVSASVATGAASSLTNTATVSGGGELNTANNTASDPTTIINGPQILLVKRITALNGVSIPGFVVDPVNTADLNANWPSPASTYLRGALTATNVQSGDLVEYTIYFLSSGGRNATNFLLCDLVPTNMTFVPYSYTGLTPTDGGLSGVDSGIALALSTTALPTVPTAYLTNTADSDRGQFYAPGTQAPAAANSGSGFAVPLPASSNLTGVVAVSVVTSPTAMPFSTGPGVPINSYGFIRFQAKVN